VICTTSEVELRLEGGWSRASQLWRDEKKESEDKFEIRKKDVSNERERERERKGKREE
jgi:hypothetical protein